MRTLLASVFLAVAAAAQPCIQFGLAQRSRWDLCPVLQYENLHAQHFAHVEFVPCAGGIGLLLYYDISAYSNLFYGEEMIYTDTTNRAYGWELGPCAQRSWTTLGLWWDDRGSDPQPGDTLHIRGYALPGIDLRAMPTGTMFRTTYDLPLVPMVTRANVHHWNTESNKPHYWAVLIVPTSGRW